MEMKRLGAGRVRVALSAHELETMQLNYEAIDCRSPKTQALLYNLVATAQLQTGFDPGCRLLAEFFSDGADGCVIYLSDADAPDLPPQRRQVTSPVIYCFDDLNTLISGAIKLFARCSHRIRKSSLYTIEKSWRLELYPLDMVENITLAFLDEFAPRCGEGELAAAALHEHGRLLLQDNAVDLLASYFS